jgi:hypothetical protein
MSTGLRHSRGVPRGEPSRNGPLRLVYRPRDRKLDRDVAIKVLPDLFADDSDRLSRFERDAKTLASLSHAHIAQIYGLGESGSVRALVMELIDLKHANVKVRDDGTVKVLGFGRLSRHRRPMAHEQAKGRIVTPPATAPGYQIGATVSNFADVAVQAPQRVGLG